MEFDDRLMGRVLTRREALALLGATGMVVLAGCRREDAATPGAAKSGADGLPTCVVRPDQIEGPYFVDEELNRSDIRSDPADGSETPGAPLGLTFRVTRVGDGACPPLAGAIVDVWQCDALGVYSDARDRSFDTRGKKFLRGYQVTDPDGIARFTTIYPGWYRGRTVHVHFKIRSAPAARQGFEFTSQLYFDDAVTDRVHSHPPYAAKGPRDVRNDDDGIFARGGPELLLPIQPADAGYAATFDVALDLT